MNKNIKVDIKRRKVTRKILMVVRCRVKLVSGTKKWCLGNMIRVEQREPLLGPLLGRGRGQTSCIGKPNRDAFGRIQEQATDTEV